MDSSRGVAYRIGMRVLSFVHALSSLLFLASTTAQVVGVEITRREDILGGRAFGAAGAYEKLVGTVSFAFDPAAPGNRAVVDLDLAPRDRDGRVPARADLYVIQPKDAAKRSGVALLEVCNRGGKSLLARFCGGRHGADPQSEADFGDGLLLHAGHTLLWVGWQFDVPDREGLLRFHAPTAQGDERGIEGLVRANWLVEDAAEALPLAHRDHRPYRPAKADDPRNVLTERGDGKTSPLEATRRVVPRELWHFVDDERAIALDGGFLRGRIYELVYAAREPAIVGLGLAALRDVALHAKTAADCPFPARHVVAIGVSQSGRLLRHALAQDFHTAPAGPDAGLALAFDGVFAIVAGAGRGSFNHRFAQPSRDAHRLHSFEYPTDLFPFTSRALDDAVTGMRGGIVEGRTRRAPKIFQLNGGYEYWGRAASLVHTTVDGTSDVEPLPSERLYAIAGAQHFDQGLPRAARGDVALHRGHPLDTIVVQRALLVALLDWVTKDQEPPPSRIPRVADATLVPRAELRFPALPAVTVPLSPYVPRRLDFGPAFEEGIAGFEPPRAGAPFGVRVPQTDELGNELGGIRTVELLVPLATYAPWHPHALFRSEPEPFIGSFIPLPRDEAERARTKDPRPSLAELQPSLEVYRERVRAAIERLVGERLLLPVDQEHVAAHADSLWQWLNAR